MDPIQILRPDDLASLLGVTKMTLFRMEKRGELPARKNKYQSAVLAGNMQQ